MQRFTIETPGGKRLTIEAPDEATAMRGAQDWHAQQSRPVVLGSADPMGSDGMSGDQLRANAAGNTRSQMRPQDIEAAYAVAQARGDRPEQQAMANAFVDRERRDSPLMTGAGDRFRSMARGVPFVGEFFDEANARTAHPFDAKKREMRLDYERARDTSFDAANPYQSMAGKVTGGIAGTIAMLPMAAATGTSALLGAGAKTVQGAILRGLGAGVTQGAASGYGREGTLEGAARDAAIGAAFGAGVPAAMSLGKAGIDRLVGAFAPSDILSSVPKKARAYFLNQFSPKNMTSLRDELDRIGPNAVLADVSPEMQMMARGAASRPGSREAIVNALTVRDQGKNARIATAMDESLGPVMEPSAIRQEIGKAVKGVNAQYDPALESAARIDTAALAQKLDAQIVDARGPVRAALQEARDMLNIYGTKELDPNPRGLLNARITLGGLEDAAGQTGNQPVASAYGDARKAIDKLLTGSVPNLKAVDAQRASLFRQEQALEDAPSLFQSGPNAARPADVAARVAAALPEEALRISQGARAELDRIVGTNANDVAALRNFLKGEGDWNRQKLTSIFGADKAGKILNILDNETKMEATYRAVVGGTATAPTQGFKEFLDKAGQGVTVPAEATAVGLSIRGAKALLERATGSNNAAKAARFADELGNLSIAGGTDADRIIAAIMKRQAQASSGEKFNEAFGRIGAGTARADDPMAIKLAIAAAILGRDAAKMRGSDQSGSRR
jgi:hypothetical protein